MKEIDLRSLLNNNLECEDHNISPSSLGNDKTINLIDRPFENEKRWSKVEKINYIESVFLNCSLQPIIRFKNNNHTIIVDGYNRYSTITDFYNDNLILEDKGLNQLKFLKNKKFSDLTSDEKNFFNKNACIKVLDYSCKNIYTGKTYLEEDEELEVLKYLYTIYNSGIKLEIEEIQKAQFYDDYITEKLRNKINEDEEFLNILEKLKLYNGKRKRNKLENILLNCRLLISSTYSNIYNFSYTPDIQTRIEENYLPNIYNFNKKNIYEDFILNINQIYNSLIATQKWEKYPILHCKPFIEATYWLISVIRKDNLINPLDFDFMNYLEYFGRQEEENKNFDIYYAHYSKNIFKKYYTVAQYFEKKYTIDLSKYFKNDLEKNSSDKLISSMEELYKRDFNFTPEKVKISNILKDLQESSYNIRPYYQRKEIMNTNLSSKIIESLLLGIRIPYILMCDKFISNDYVTEVVDGQQRLLSIISFLSSPFMNENNELEYSNKNGYSLKNLRILSELNNMSYQKNKNKKQLPEKYTNQILNSDLYIYKTKNLDISNNNMIDYFVRLNKKTNLIKENSFRMFNLTADKRIIKFCMNSSDEFINSVLPKNNKHGKPYIITLRLGYLIYNNCTEVNYSNYSNYKVARWLNDFNIFKTENIYSNCEKIDILRIKYYKSFNEVKKFYMKVLNFLQKCNKTLDELVHANSMSQIPLSDYYHLYCLLLNVREDILINKNEKIYSIINSYFILIKEKKLANKELYSLLEFYINQILVLDPNLN